MLKAISARSYEKGRALTDSEWGWGEQSGVAEGLGDAKCPEISTAVTVFSFGDGKATSGHL